MSDVVADLQYVRRFRRRIFAFIIDSIILALISAALLFPFASTLDSSVRRTSGLINTTSCKEGVGFTARGENLVLGSWQKSLICDFRFDLIFPHRALVLLRSGTTPSGLQYSENIRLPLDSQNRLASIFPDLLLTWPLALLYFIFFESSKQRSTPGKHILGLHVSQENSSRLSLRQSVLRTSLKFLFGVVLLLLGWLEYLQLFAVTGMIIDPNSTSLNYSILASVWMLVLLNIPCLIIMFSVFYPWPKMGRGLYDKWSGAYVRYHGTQQTTEQVL